MKISICLLTSSPYRKYSNF